MKKRPLPVTIISWIFIAVGGAALLTSLISEAASRIQSGHPLIFWLTLFIQILGIISGVFMLYGFNWARWLLACWLGYHIIISALHSPLEVLVHSLLFAVVLYFIFRPQATAYFLGARSE